MAVGGSSCEACRVPNAQKEHSNATFMPPAVPCVASAQEGVRLGSLPTACPSPWCSW